MVQDNENAGISQTEAAPTQASESMETSTVLGKFKDVDALKNAYEALQAEFTRRSQRLRALEREVENFQASATPSGAEKLRKTAKARREEAKEFDALVAELNEGANGKPSLSEKAVSFEQGADEEGVEQKSSLKAPTDGEKYRPTSEELYQKVSEDETVRLRVVGEYLASIGRSGAPLTGGGTGALATPPKRAKTVGQAGDMALLYFRGSALE